MLRLTFKNIWAHKMRLMLSMVSIFLGVAFLSGTLVLLQLFKNHLMTFSLLPVKILMSQ